MCKKLFHGIFQRRIQLYEVPWKLCEMLEERVRGMFWSFAGLKRSVRDEMRFYV